MHNQDHSHNSNITSNVSLSMRLLNPPTNYPNTSMNYSLIGYNAHPNTIHASFQGSNNASYQSNSLWSLNDHSDNNPSNFNTISSNNNDNAFSMNNQYQQVPHSLAFSQQPRPQQNPQQQQQRLKVEDALNYLDQVKLQFGHQPQIYNDFLDIMKEFKSHSIDTTGVIMRVSRLFRDHPELIVGFNTFLPPGYNIEVHENETIQVYQPGQQVLSLNINNVDDIGFMVNNQESALNVPIASAPCGVVNSNLMVGIVNNNGVVNNVPSNNEGNFTMQQSNIVNASQTFYPHSNHQYPHNNQAPPPQPTSFSFQAGVSSLNSGRQKHHEPSSQNSNHQPVEFNHAISYVNKIKNCYQDKPETYKAFLDILHNYQKEQKLLKEAQHKNLNPASTTRRAQITESEVYSQVSQLFKDQPELLREFRQFLPDATHPDNNNKMHRQSLMSLGASAKSSQTHNLTPHVSPRSADWNNHPPHKKAKLDIVDRFHNLFHNSELTSAVDRAQSQGKEHVLREVLRQMEALRTPSFKDLCQSPLLDKLPEMKQLLQSNISKEMRHLSVSTPLTSTYDVETKKESSKKSSEKKSKTCVNKMQVNVKEEKRWYLDLKTCKKVGKSYRLLPNKFPNELASNRGSLEKQVLNDQYTLYPHSTTDSENDEDDGEEDFDSSSRRNVHEDHVFQCEDERYELDMVIDLNKSVLRELSKLASRMRKMSSEELAKFQVDDLQNTLGVSDVHIETVFRRLYGDKCTVVIEGLKKCPRITVPVALKSLSSKDSEWRNSKRLFERLWSEQMEKHYLRSLDHQGLKFKQSDAKALRSKSLVKEVEMLLPDEHDGEEEDEANDENKKRKKKSIEANQCGNSIKRLNLPFPYQSAYEDAVGLVWTGIQKQSSSDDQEKLKYLLDHLIPSIFFQHNPPDPTVISDDSEEEKHEGNNDEHNHDDKSHNQKANNKKKFDKNEASTRPYKAPSLFICNENWYVVLRLMLLLCERLNNIRNTSESMVAEESTFKPLRTSLAHMALTVRSQDSTDPRQYYSRFLSMVASLMTGSCDATSFEDTLRELFGVNCYVVFTIDKLIQHVVRQMQHVISKEESLSVQEEYINYLRVEGENCDRKNIENYQEKVEEVLNDKMIFKHFIDPVSKLLSVQLLPVKNQQNANSNCNKNGKKSENAVKKTLNEEHTSAVHVNRFLRARNNLKRKEAVAVWSGVPDFYRKFRRRQKLPPLEEPSAETRLMQALNTLAMAHAKSTSRGARLGREEEDSNGERSDVVLSNVVKLKEDGKELLRSKEETNDSEHDISHSRIKLLVETTTLICRPQSFATARRLHKSKTLMRLKRFERWMQVWLKANTTPEGVSSILNWLQGVVSDGNKVTSSNISDKKQEECDSRIKEVLVQKLLINPDMEQHYHLSFLCHADYKNSSLLPVINHYISDNDLSRNIENNVDRLIETNNKIKLINRDSGSILMKNFNYEKVDKIEINKNELINECINAFAKHDNKFCNNLQNANDKSCNKNNQVININRPPYRFYHKYRLTQKS